jgi:hypothetical protein
LPCNAVSDVSDVGRQPRRPLDRRSSSVSDGRFRNGSVPPSELKLRFREERPDRMEREEGRLPERLAAGNHSDLQLQPTRPCNAHTCTHADARKQ